MTSNQLKNQQNAIEERKARELERANKTREAEDRRSNLERESENRRHNKRTETIQAVTGALNAASNAVGSAAKFAGSANDPSWYNLDPQLVKDTANVSYGTPLGIPVRQYTNWTNGVFGDVKTPVPGAMVLRYVPTVGPVLLQEAAAANVAAKNVYAFVRHANSGSTNYEATDLFMYLLSMDSMYSLLAWMMRSYSLALTAKSVNRYYPTAILQGLGWDVDDLLSHLSEFRAIINLSVSKVGIFNVPANFPYFNRHIWMNMNIFKDQEIKKSQEYLFTPEVVFYYDESVTPGKLTPIQMNLPGSSMKVSDIATTMNILIGKAIASEDFGIMSGDIYKAYGDNLFKISEIEEKFHIESTYSMEVLSQINNAVMVGPIGGNVDTTAINQTTTGLIYQGLSQDDPGIKISVMNNQPADIPILAERSCLINMYKDDVSPDDTMVATRLICTSEYFSAASATEGRFNYYKKVRVCGSEIITQGIVIRLQANGTAGQGTFVRLSSNLYSTGELTTMMSLVSAVAPFDWAPRLNFIYISGDPGAYSVGGFLSTFDYANYADINSETIEAMHQVAILSEFAVPLIGNRRR